MFRKLKWSKRLIEAQEKQVRFLPVTLAAVDYRPPRREAAAALAMVVWDISGVVYPEAGFDS